MGVLVAACSSSGDDSASPTSDAAPADASTEATSTEATSTESSLGSADVPSDVAAGRPELPGLLDDSNEKIRNDAAVRVGVLDNGLRYYIRQNDNPGGKAELRLAVKAGSVDEFGPSTGVAHFVEHMLFNGTEQFPENELIDVLRSFGAAFGADINAYTTFDETVYELTVPNQQQSLQAGLNVLEQWLSHATFDPDQVIAERGVVLDEWRVRTQSLDGRLFEVAERMYLAGTAYADRSPIGTDDSISGMTDIELRDYYDTWYRPDNAAIIVVGDIDVDDVEADIQRLFGPAVSRAEPRTAIEVGFETTLEPAYGLHADPDQRTVDVEVTLPLPTFDGNGTASWRLRADRSDRQFGARPPPRSGHRRRHRPVRSDRSRHEQLRRRPRCAGAVFQHRRRSRRRNPAGAVGRVRTGRPLRLQRRPRSTSPRAPCEPATTRSTQGVTAPRTSSSPTTTSTTS